VSDFWRTFFTIVLLGSLGLNYYFWTKLKHSNVEETTIVSSANKTRTNNSITSPSSMFSSNRIQPVITGTSSNSNSDLEQQAQNLFSQHDFDEAVDLWLELQTESELIAQEILSQWQSQVLKWLRGGRMNLAQQFLQSFLHQQPYNLNMLEIEAVRLSFIGQYNEAIDVYRTIIDNSINPSIKQSFLTKIHNLVKQHKTSLEQGEQLEALVEFIEPLIYDEPNHLPYQYILAKTLLKLNRLEDARAYLQQLLSSDEYYQQASELLANLNKKQQGQQAVNLAKQGAHFIVPGQFNEQTPIALMIDTGASLSVLSQQSFDRLSGWLYPEFIRNANMNTAGGMVNAPIYRFEAFQIGDYQVKDIDFVVMELSQFEKADGLLGMNFLQNFVFLIDQEKQQLFLKQR